MRTRFCFVDVEFEKPVNHPGEDVKQAVGNVDLELRGRGPAAINLGAVTVLMVFKARMNEISQGVSTRRARGTSWHLPLALPGMATPGTILLRALSWVQYTSSSGCRSLWPFLIRVESGQGVSGLAGCSVDAGAGERDHFFDLLSPSLCFPKGSWVLFFLSFPIIPLLL